MKDWLALARRPDVVRRSLRLSMIVGTVLMLINYGDKILFYTMTSTDWLKLLVTYLVPYSVSTVAIVNTLRKQNR